MAQTKSAKVVGLFVAAALTISGCSSGANGYDDDCYDSNNDGYCDDGGRGGSSSTYVGSGGSKYNSNTSGITSGSKGGIGSSGTSSSG
ncbi:hypothetical protein BRE01_28450 [Brevibacillus reuszeri]|uniref:Lipoprotein n=1 Tax=Brevibacillus reuszeri TaxID=54915 RepID=A0A0K9YIZ9_9BACL|nr:hypothetical protein [Brevibacillus reuszeri]KNB68641.1 hypothetical protein ADS79_32235 [Brevibacillus reuszeri]MED1858930.1 hypothetical protein [Brevibacillus reuszeri]GED69143.1 hypothetical protein BRE01_28450 [Brevibacillus reuszeri]